MMLIENSSNPFRFKVDGVDGLRGPSSGLVGVRENEHICSLVN